MTIWDDEVSVFFHTLRSLGRMAFSTLRGDAGDIEKDSLSKVVSQRLSRRVFQIHGAFYHV